jgi:hypothetical protein
VTTLGAACSYRSRLKLPPTIDILPNSIAIRGQVAALKAVPHPSPRAERGAVVSLRIGRAVVPAMNEPAVDVHDPKAWEGQVHVSEPEREAFRALIALGLKDSFRLFEQPEKSFSWWDYGMMAFRRNAGLRIDHILLSPALAARC